MAGGQRDEHRAADLAGGAGCAGGGEGARAPGLPTRPRFGGPRRGALARAERAFPSLPKGRAAACRGFQGPHRHARAMLEGTPPTAPGGRTCSFIACAAAARSEFGAAVGRGGELGLARAERVRRRALAKAPLIWRSGARIEWGKVRVRPASSVFGGVSLPPSTRSAGKVDYRSRRLRSLRARHAAELDVKGRWWVAGTRDLVSGAQALTGSASRFCVNPRSELPLPAPSAPCLPL